MPAPAGRATWAALQAEGGGGASGQSLACGFLGKEGLRQGQQA